jgi:hypothetical protein
LLHWKRRGRLTPRRLIDLNTFWVVGCLALFAVASKLETFDSFLTTTAATGLAVAAAIIGVLGIVSRTEKDWTAASGRRVGLYVAWAGAFIAIMVADQVDPSWRLDQQMAVQVFEGMLTLGVPLAIHGRLARRAPAANRFPVLTHLLFFVIGMLVAFGIMHVDYADWRWLLISIPAWGGILWVARRFCPSWDRLAGAMAGAMLAAGTTLYWRLPMTICVPFHPAIPSLETLTLWYEARRALGFDVQLGLTFAGIAAGALSGWLVFRGRPDPWSQSSLPLPASGSRKAY